MPWPVVACVEDPRGLCDGSDGPTRCLDASGRSTSEGPKDLKGTNWPHCTRREHIPVAAHAGGIQIQRKKVEKEG